MAYHYKTVKIGGGDDVEDVDAELVAWFREGADKGSAVAMYNLGVCFEYGKGLPENRAEASKLYTRAAEGWKGTRDMFRSPRFEVSVTNERSLDAPDARLRSWDDFKGYLNATGQFIVDDTLLPHFEEHIDPDGVLHLQPEDQSLVDDNSKRGVEDKADDEAEVKLRDEFSHEWERHHDTKLSVVTTRGTKFFVGVQIATLLNKQTFNLYRALRKRHSKLLRAALEVVHHLVDLEAVERSTRSVMFLPYDDVIEYMEDTIDKRAKRGKRGVQGKSHKHTSDSSATGDGEWEPSEGGPIDQGDGAGRNTTPLLEKVEHRVVRKRERVAAPSSKAKKGRKRKKGKIGGHKCVDCNATASSNWYTSPDGQPRSWCATCYQRAYHARKMRRGGARVDNRTKAHRSSAYTRTPKASKPAITPFIAEKSLRKRSRKSAVVHRAIRLDESDFYYNPRRPWSGSAKAEGLRGMFLDVEVPAAME